MLTRCARSAALRCQSLTHGPCFAITARQFSVVPPPLPSTAPVIPAFNETPNKATANPLYPKDPRYERYSFADVKSLSDEDLVIELHLKQLKLRKLRLREQSLPDKRARLAFKKTHKETLHGLPHDIRVCTAEMVQRPMGCKPKPIRDAHARFLLKQRKTAAQTEPEPEMQSAEV